MFKTIIVIIVAVAAFAYFNDPKSLQPWSEIVSDAGKATAKVVKMVGEEAGDKLHKMTRDDSTLLDRAKNSIEDTSDAVSDAGKAAAKAVKRVGEETGDKLHKMTRDDSTILDRAKNSIEDTASDTKKKINEAVDNK